MNGISALFRVRRQGTSLAVQWLRLRFPVKGCVVEKLRSDMPQS